MCVALGDGLAEGVMLDPRADALALGGNHGDFKRRSLAQGAAASLEIFVGCPGDGKAGKQAVVGVLAGDTWGVGLEVDVVDLSCDEILVQLFEVGLFGFVELRRMVGAGKDEVAGECFFLRKPGDLQKRMCAFAWLEPDDADDGATCGLFLNVLCKW